MFYYFLSNFVTFQYKVPIEIRKDAYFIII